MRLLDRLIRRDSYWEGMASGAAVLTTTYGQPGREQVLPQLMSQAHRAYGSDSPVFAAVLARMALFSEAEFVLQSAADKKMFTDQRLQILQHPWPDGTGGDLLARMEQDVSVAGNAYIWHTGEELVRLRPDWVTIVSELVTDALGRQYRRVTGYWFQPPKSSDPRYGEPAMYDADEVAHWAPIPDPTADFRGMSWLTPVLREIAGDSGLTEYKIKYLEHAASPNLLLKYAQKLQPGTIDALRERMTARYGGVDNAFRTLILDQGADATVIGNSLSQMNFDTVQQAGSDRILAAAGVPGMLVGLEPVRGAGKAYADVVRRFADITMRPEWRSVCGALHKLIPDMPDQGIRLWYDTSQIAALQEGEQTKAQITLIHGQALLTLRQAGYTRESAVKAIQGNDVSLLQVDPLAPLPQGSGQQPQHMLPQPPGSGPTPGLKPLPEGSTPRLTDGAVSPGDGGNGTRPAGRPASVRRDANGHE